MEAAIVYLPMDRRQALAWGKTLPEHTHGAALFADISGFTPLTEALAQELGPKRGAEELAVHLNRVYDALIAELHRFGGSVVSFSGDAITCWLDGDDGARATACALAMQRTMAQFVAVQPAPGWTVSLAMKAAVASGPVCRLLVGDPQCCIADVLAGRTLDRLAEAEHLAGRGEVLLTPETAAALVDRLRIQAWRQGKEPVLSGDGGIGEPFAVAAGLAVPVPESPWPALPPGLLSEEQIRPWLLLPVWQRLQSGQGEFLAELRPAVSLFVRFGGIDYDCDPAARDKLDAFIRGVQRIVLRYEGSLLQLTIGDKGSYLYAAFGAPVAHEDDATRAARAALEVQSLAAETVHIGPVQIGITQGRMRTGAYGSRTRRTYGVLGDAVNLSARLMLAAGPGHILVGDRARTATGTGFVWEQLPSLQVKGKAEPVAVSRLVGLRPDRAIRLLEPRYALPMVGREAELALIAHKTALVLQGRGQIVGITGEAGMGKSRLAAEAIRMAQDRGLTGYGGECQSYGTQTSYLVWQRIWRDLFGLEAALPSEQQVQALEVRLSQIDPGLLPRLPLLGPVLNLPIPDNDLTRSLEAKVRKASLQGLLVDCLQAQASQNPLLLVLEDCHWLDPLSHELIEVIGRAIVNLPVMVLLVYRPPDVRRLQAPRVSQLAHFSEVALTQFTPQEAGQLIWLKLGQFFGPQAEAPSGLVAQIIDRAAGNPFYIEELLNYLKDRDIHPQDREALAAVDLPSSLHSLILSRMDQLTNSQQATIRVASVIGRLFPAAMVWGVHPRLGTPEQILADLRVLDDLDLTPLENTEPEQTYLFKHIITQEVAYESLLYATRAMLHEQIGCYLEATYPETLDRYVHLLAYHYDRSESEAKKREYLLKAGERAQRDYANEAAIEYYEKALPLLQADARVSVLLKLGKVLELTGDWGAAGKQYEHALSLAKQIGDRRAQAWCEAAVAELLRKQGQYREASDTLAQAREAFGQMGDLAGVGQVLHCAGIVADQQGDYKAARALYELSLEIRRELDDKLAEGSLLSNLGIVARRQGELVRARALYEESLAVRRELNDRWAIAITLNNMGNLALDQGHLDQAFSYLEEAVALQREVGDRWMIGNALNNLANVARHQGDHDRARTLYGESLAIYRVLADKWALAYLFEDVGCLAVLEGQAACALRLASAASALRDEIGAPLSAAEKGKLEQVLAQARQTLGQTAQTQAWAEGAALSLEEAIEVAVAAADP